MNSNVGRAIANSDKSSGSSGMLGSALSQRLSFKKAHARGAFVAYQSRKYPTQSPPKSMWGTMYSSASLCSQMSTAHSTVGFTN